MRSQELLSRARAMRREMPEPERRLWHELRARRFAGASFRRQVVIGHAIADFACRRPKMLVVEVDGETHVGRELQDVRRTRVLQQKGYEVIRFTNDEVMRNMNGVLLRIEEVLATPPLPSPLCGSSLSPEGERG